MRPGACLRVVERQHGDDCRQIALWNASLGCKPSAPGGCRLRETSFRRAEPDPLMPSNECPRQTNCVPVSVPGLLVERVEAAVEGTTDQVRVSVTWVGGHRTSHTLTRPVLRYEQTRDFPRLMARIRELRRRRALTFAAIAERRNAEGFRPRKGAGQFHKDIVSLIVRRRTPGYQPPPKSDRSALGPNEWFAGRSGPGGGDREEYAARLAAAGLGQLPPAARAADPVRLLGRSE